MVILRAAVRVRPGRGGEHLQVEGWAEQTGPITAQAEIRLTSGSARAEILRLVVDPTLATLSAWAAGGSGHYFRLADATLRPLPEQPPVITMAPGDAYIALSPGAHRLTSRPAAARFLHLHDHFNAERLAERLLDFLVEESGQPELAEDAAVVVVEAR